MSSLNSIAKSLLSCQEQKPRRPKSCLPNVVCVPFQKVRVSLFCVQRCVRISISSLSSRMGLIKAMKIAMTHLTFDRWRGISMLLELCLLDYSWSGMWRGIVWHCHWMQSHRDPHRQWGCVVEGNMAISLATAWRSVEEEQLRTVAAGQSRWVAAESIRKPSQSMVSSPGLLLPVVGVCFDTNPTNPCLFVLASYAKCAITYFTDYLFLL